MFYGFARNLRDALPNSSFIGFTGTPIEMTEANTRAVFCDYLSIYDIQRDVPDKATVLIHYQSRILKISLNAAELATLWRSHLKKGRSFQLRFIRIMAGFVGQLS